MNEILLNKETFEGLSSRFNTAFSRAAEAAQCANNAESIHCVNFTSVSINSMFSSKANDISSVIQTIISSFTETDQKNRDKALKISEAYLGTAQERADAYNGGGGGYSAGGGGNGSFGGGGGGGQSWGGGGFRGSNIAQDIWSSIKDLPNDIKEGWQTCKDVTAWYNNLPKESREIVEKVASVICDKVDGGGSLFTSLQMVRDIFSAESGLEAAEKVIDSVGKVAGNSMKAGAGATGLFGAAISIDCAMLTDYTKGMFKAVTGAIKGDTNAGFLFRWTGKSAANIVKDIKNGDWGSAGKHSLKTIVGSSLAPLILTLDGAAEGAGYIYDGMASTTESISNFINWSWGKDVLAASMRDEAESLRNFV